MLGSLLDDALDRTVIGGYTNLGYSLRRRFWSDAATGQRMDGRTVVVTGATSGLGLAAAQGFAALGASVILVARDRERGERAQARVAESGDAPTELALCDLADQASIRDLVRRLGDRGRLDVLVNNAGVLCQRRTETADGIETALAVNVLAPYLLTALLADQLGTSDPGRVITVSSGGMYAQRLRAGDLQSTDGKYSGAAVYARTKRAEVILTEQWADRLRDRNVVVHAMHPGWADTPGVAASLPGFHRLTRPLLRTPAQGADTIVWLGSAAEPARSTGGFWHDRRRRPAYLLPGTRESDADRRRLWAECERLAGLSR